MPATGKAPATARPQETAGTVSLGKEKMTLATAIMPAIAGTPAQ
jgi:hypothetical protein